MKILALPDLGEGLQEAEIVAWHAGVGDHVVTDQPLVSVETEKAVVEIPAPYAGRIARLCGAIGARIKVGQPLVEFEEGVASDTGTVVGELADVVRARPAPAVVRPPPAAAIRAVPAARALARELGVDLSSVEPTGPDRTITKSDVERAAQVAAGAVRGAELKGVRRAMALNMARSGSAVVSATIVDEADVSTWPQGADVTIRLVRAVVAGCRASPALNAWYDGRTLVRQIHDKIDLGVAVDTEDGLFVPVLRDVANRDAADLRRGLEAMKADLLARKVPLSELRGQTITLSNFGMLAGRFGGLVVVPPQVAILGAGRMAPRVVAIDEQPAVHRTLPLSLTFDHRAVTGAEAARFLRAALGELERPE